MIMDITKRLEIKSNMIFMGERIAFGSECVLMDEAIIEIQTLRAKVEVLVEALEAVHGTTLVNYTNKTKLKFISKYALEALATVKGE